MDVNNVPVALVGVHGVKSLHSHHLFITAFERVKGDEDAVCKILKLV